MESVTLLERRARHGRRAQRGPAPAGVRSRTRARPRSPRPEDADVDVPVGDDLSLALRGRTLPAADQRVLAAFAAQAAVALEQQRLAAEAEAARPIAEADRMRTALLAAVSHDLRTPLASAKAAVTSLRCHDVEWTAEDRERTARHRRRVAGPADPPGREPARHEPAAGRGAVSVPAAGRARRDRAARARRPRPGRPGTARRHPGRVPEVLADPALLERVVANLVGNALRYSPAGQPPLLAASALGDRVELRVIDRGPGIPDERPGPGLPAVPAARRHRQHHRASASASRCPGA